MSEGILAAQDRLRAEPRLRAVVLHGEGRAFCAGLDISRFKSMGSGESRGHTLAGRIARRSPDAIRAAKRLLSRSADDDAAALLATESREQERLMGGPNQVEAVRAEMEQRPTAFGALLPDP